MDYSKYFSQAEGRAKLYLNDTGDAFVKAEGSAFFQAPNYAEGVEYPNTGASGTQVTQMAAHMKVDVSRPYIVIVQNTNLVLTNYVLFGSSQNRTSATFGNAAGILVTYGLAGYTYTQLLADSEGKPFTLGRIRIDLLDSNTANLTSPISVTKTSSEGTVFTSPLTPYTALNQFQTNAIEIPCNFEVDGDTQLTGALVASSGIRVSFFPAHRWSATRELNGQPQMKGLGRPQIGAIQTIRLTQ